MPLVILVHGTAATDPEDVGERWWQRNSAFWRELDLRLAGRARCGPITGSLFRWSGANSERERRDASLRFLDYLVKLEHSRTPYHLVGHSHGGLVIWYALRLAAKREIELPHLASWSTIGTPFLNFRCPRLRLTAILPLAIFTVAVIYLSAQASVFITDFKAVSQTPRIALAALIALWTAVAAFAFYYLSLLVRRFLSFAVARSDLKFGRVASARFGARWLGLWSSLDEAVNGLRNSLELTGRIVPRWNVAIDSLLQRLLWLALAPLRFVQNVGIAPLGDDFVFDKITRRLQGADVLDLVLQDVTAGPDRLTTPPVPEALDRRLTGEADQSAADTLSRIRKSLGISAEARADLFTALDAFKNELTWRELIHNSYFGSHEVIDLVAQHILRFGASWSIASASVLTKAGAQPAPRLTLKSRSMRAIRRWAHRTQVSALATGTLARVRTRLDISRDLLGSALAGVFLVAAVALFQSSAVPYTSEYQIKQILASSQAIGLSATLEAEEVYTVEEWFQRLGQIGTSEETVRRLIRPSVRARSLARLARGSASAGHNDEARMWAREALAAAKTIPTDDTHFTLFYVGNSLASAGFPEEALAVFDRGSAKDRSNALDSMIAALVKSDLVDEAVALVRSAEPPVVPDSNALLVIADALVTAGRSSEALEFALAGASLARAAGSLSERVAAATILAATLAKVGRYAEATTAVQQAFADALSMPDGSDRAKALAETASAFFQIGDKSEAEKAARQAVDEVLKLAEPERSSTLKQVADSIAKIGLLDLAVQAALSRSKDYERYESLEAIATAMAAQGLVPEASKVAELIPQTAVFFRSNTYRQVGLAFVSVKKLPEAVAAFKQAELSISMIDGGEPVQKARALLELAEAVSAAGDEQKAEQLVRNAVDAIQLVASADLRVSPLLDASELFGRLGKRDASLELLDSARDSIHSDEVGPFQRSVYLKEAAELLARIGNYREARLAAEGCGAFDKLKAFTSIVGIYFGVEDRIKRLL